MYNYLQWAKTWLLRIFFFPIWMLLIWRRNRLEAAELAAEAAADKAEHEARVAQLEAAKAADEAQILAKLKEQEGRVKVFLHGVEQKPGDAVYSKAEKVEWLHFTDKLTIEYETFRRLQLMTANSTACQMGSFPVNEYALVDNGDMESVGKAVVIELVAWRPKALDCSEKDVVISYDTESEVFNSIVERANNDRRSMCMYGPELKLLVKDEIVTMFFGSKSARRVVKDLKFREGDRYILGVQKIEMKSYCFCVPRLDPFPWMWVEDYVNELKGRRLYNIIEAIKRGTWKTSGKKVEIAPGLKRALQAEWEKRAISAKKIAKYERKNKEWEQENCKHIDDVWETNTGQYICVKCQAVIYP